MTSDQGCTGEAGMQMTNTTTPVTTKAPGLNPHANVFQIKTPENITTPPSECGSSECPTEFACMNGDVGKSPPPPGVVPTVFPPTPESPMSVGQADYSTTNGVLEGQTLFPSDGGQGQDELPLDSNITDDQRRAMIKTQLEYYFSRENLANDSYLVSQMDADQYVSIATIASFNQVKRLTNDLELVIEILRESGNVQVDEKGEKVRPLHKRCIVILREIPDSTPVEAIEKLFSGENCPPFISCEFAHNDSWYVTFDSEEDAQKAYRYLREEVCTFLGKPIMARIKAKPLLHNTFVPKNGFKQTYDAPVYSQPQKYTQYPPVANISYLPNQQSYPFFPPSGTGGTSTPTASSIPHVWPTSPGTLQYFDPGTAFAANGYTPSTTIKAPAGRQPSFGGLRHNRNQKLHRAGSLNNREQGSLSQGDHQDRTADHDRLDHRDPQRDRNSATSRDGTRSDRYQEHHSSGTGRPFKSESGITATSHYHGRHHHGAAPMNMHHSDGRSYHTHHHLPGQGQPSQGHGNGPHPHGLHQHAHAHSYNSHMPGDRDRDRDHDRDIAITSSSHHPCLSDANSRDQFSSQPLRRGGAYRTKRRLRGSDDNGAIVAKEKSSCEPPNFDLADTSFPPLPGSVSNASSNEVFENKMSDVVKGTVKPSKPASNVATSSTIIATTTASTAMSGSQTHTPPASSVMLVSPVLAQPTSSGKESDESVASQVSYSSKTSATSAKSAPCSAKTSSTVATSDAASVKMSSTSSKPTVIATTTSVPVSQSSMVTMASVVTGSTGAPTAQPQSPQKVSKSTCTDSSGIIDGTTAVSATASTSTQTCSQGPTSGVTASAAGTNSTASQVAPSAQDEKMPKKLSYAEMAQRGKAQVIRSVEKVKPEDASSKDQSQNGLMPNASGEVKEVVSQASSATASAVPAMTSAGTGSPVQRDQRLYGGRRAFNTGRREERKNGREPERAGYYRRGNREQERSRVK